MAEKGKDNERAASKLSDVYVYEESRTAPSTSNITLTAAKLKAGEVVIIDSFSVIDVTTANKTLRLGYDRGGSKFWLKRQAAGTSSYHITLDSPLILVENEAPAAMVESPTSSDSLLVVARGRRL